jgi:hypothetical protein
VKNGQLGDSQYGRFLLLPFPRPVVFYACLGTFSGAGRLSGTEEINPDGNA